MKFKTTGLNQAFEQLTKIIGFLLLYLTTTFTHAQLTPYTCSSNLYLIQNGTGAFSSTMAVNLTDTSTSPFTYSSLGASASHFYNAVGYNTNDNFMYGILGNSNHLIKIGNNGATQDLGAVTNLPGSTSNFYNSGAFDLAGNLYVKEGSTTTLYKINTTTLTATAISLNKSFFSADIAWHQGNLYAIDNTADVYKINPTTGAVTTIGNAGNPTVNVLFGALYGSPNGLFAVQNSGGFFEFDVNTGARILISPSPATSSNDGAHCATQNVVFGTDLDIVKTNNQDRYVPGQITYTITVTNKGPFGAFGATVSDPLPSGITTATWSCVASAGSSCTASGTGAINDTKVNLLLNGTATYTSTITVPSTHTSNLVNTATVSVGDSSVDNIGTNNSSTDTDLPATKLVTVKTASQSPLVVGQSGQSYQINITVTNGPTSAPITIADALPSGITTSGAITATGGSLSGCPAAGATNLTGCSIASGVADGTITITVPVNVSNSAAASVSNTATVSGGGDPRCPAGADCKGSVTTPVLDAVNDSVTKQPNISTTTTLSGNDKFPTGSTFTQESTTCSPAGTVSSSGVASYTTPGANSSCTVTYKVCAPSPNQTICDTAVLTISTGDEPSYTVTKTASQSPFVVGASGQSYQIRISVSNGPTTAPITIADTLPTGMTTSGAITAAGGTISGCPASGASNLSGCSIAAGAANGNIDITVPVTIAATAANPSINQATASGGGSTKCPADASCSSTNTNPVIDAVNDAVNKQPNVVTTTDVSDNDKFPDGSTFTQESTTCSPAGTVSSSGEASYTTPSANSSCTVTYKVCAPSPNQSVCDTAVLTVSSGDEPSYTVTKTASQSPFVVGASGQSYQIRISVSNGPTTAPITIADTLPTGMTTSGAITATGGTISGCPASGASNLSGCSIAAGAANGNIDITVPVTIAATAANPSVNQATVSGGGSTKCPADASCSGSNSNPVIDAVNDPVNKQPNIVTTTDVSGNDKFPTGSTFTQESTTCSPAGTVSSSGVASYTTPSANSSCTVTYKVCAPSPNQTVCDTAVLTVTTGAEPSYTVAKTASQSPFVVGASGQSYKIRITVSNGPTTAPITIADTLPTGMTTSGAISATGGTISGCPASGASNLSGCSIAAGAANGNIDITVPVTITATAANPSVNQATVSGGGSTKCPADASCSGSNSNPVIDAVNDAVNKQPNVVTTTDVAANDKFPDGSSFTQESTTCSPAGTMSSDGVASYTTPAVDSSCTVTYKVCAPSPNQAICDTAVLTVTAGKEPSYTVTKTTSQTPLVVGQSGQSYQITITLIDGPTTADLTISDTLPPGITTNGVITATGATISSCPASGATSLAGCKIVAGAASGNIVITVPVAVGSSVASSVSNTASASGGGSSKCPGDASCSGSVTTPVINAINDTVNKPANTITSTNVSANDVFPAGSTFSQVATTCSPAGTTSSDGVISYQSPGNNSSCTVTYKVCAPSPNQTVCDTAVLTVTVGAPPTLTVVKSSSSSSFTEGLAGQYYTLTITLKNGPATEDVVISDTLPAGMTISDAITVSGTGATLSGCPAVGASNLSGCKLLAGLPNGIFKIKVPVNVSSSAVSPSTNTVTLSGGGDPICTGVAPACTSENTIIVSSQKIDVVKAVALPVQISEKVFDIEYGIVVKNVGNSSPTVFNVQVNDDLNDTFPTAQNITVSQYSVISYSGSAVCTPATQFTGVGSFTKLLAGTDDLTGDQACGIQFKVRVDYGSNPVPTVTQNNLAVATGTASNATNNPGISSSANTSFNANNIPAGISTLDMSVNSVSSNTSKQVVLPSPPSIRGGDSSSGAASPTVLTVSASLQLTLKKSVSQTEAVAGDVLTYKITIKNSTLSQADAQITDTPPAGFEYVLGSAKVAGRAVEATQTGANLVFTVNSIAANSSVTLVYQMKVTEQIVAGKLQNCASLKNTSSGSTSAASCASVIVKTGLLLEKITNQESAEIGDTVEYSLRVKSIGGATENVTITDQLPLGFKLIPGLSKLIKAGVSTTLNNIQGAPGPVLSFNVGTVGHNEIVEVRYRVRVDFGAELGDGVNSAQAKAPYANSSLVKKVKLKIKPGVFTREACIVGMVYADCNQNQMKEKEELSIPFVRLYLEDGSSLVTDRNGQYSVCGIRAISHVVKVDSTTMPTGSVLGIHSSANLGSASSVLLHVKAGELARADFTEVSCKPEVIEQIQLRSNQLFSKPAVGNQKQKTFSSKNAPAVSQCTSAGSKINCEVQGGVNEK